MALTKISLAALLAMASCYWPAACAQGLASNAAPVIEPRQPRKQNFGVSPQVQASLPPANLRADVSMVLVPAHVSTERGTPVINLTRDNFRIFEDGVEQKLTYFGWDDAPVSVGFLLDASGSMRNKMHKAAEAAAAFFETANASDEFFLVEFNEHAKLLLPFTSNAKEVAERVGRVHTIGRTSLFDAVHLALMQMKKARNPRKALVIVSDGGDNRSRYTAGEIRDVLEESDIQVYCMGIFDPEDQRKRTREEENGPDLLKKLAEESGGQHFDVANLDDLPDLGQRIGQDLHSQYVLGYSPEGAQPSGNYRRIQVNLAGPETKGLEVRYRHGYSAPSE